MRTLRMTLICAQMYSEVLDDAPVSPACLVEAQAAVAMLRHWEFVSVETAECRPLLHDGAPAWLISLSLQAPDRFARRGHHDGLNADASELEGSLCRALLEIFSNLQVTSSALTSEPEAAPAKARRSRRRFDD